MNGQLELAEDNTPSSVAERRPRRALRTVRPAPSMSTRWVHSGVCSVHQCKTGMTGLCAKCLGYELLSAGWEPTHLLTREEIARYRATHPPFVRPQRGMSAGHVSHGRAS